MEELLAAYEELYGKKPIGRWANDQDWLAKKVADKRDLEEFKASQPVKTEPVEAPKAKKEGVGIAVVKLKNQVIREYRQDKHGDKYLELAQSFVSQYADYRIEEQIEVA